MQFIPAADSVLQFVSYVHAILQRSSSNKALLRHLLLHYEQACSYDLQQLSFQWCPHCRASFFSRGHGLFFLCSLAMGYSFLWIIFSSCLRALRIHFFCLMIMDLVLILVSYFNFLNFDFVYKKFSWIQRRFGRQDRNEIKKKRKLYWMQIDIICLFQEVSKPLLESIACYCLKISENGLGRK